MKKIILFGALMCQLAVAAQKTTVVIQIMTDYGTHEAFAQQAVAKLEAVINSDEFKQAVLNASFTKTDGHSNQEIYEMIKKAHEVQGDGGADQVIDLRLRTITLEKDGKHWIKNCALSSWAGTIGIDGQGDGITAICPQRLELWAKTNDVAQLAAHYAHEYMHILGFSHRGIGKYRSVVYQIGNIIEAMIKKGD
ncbi:MAG TPA: hypothetical protein VK528_12495 [Flavobacterium sp.]|nr:hypothetical protein [Flavobacterium sp.]